MAIHEEHFRISDDSRSFTAQQLSSIWEWLDSYDMQPLRSRDGARLECAPLTFTQDTYTVKGTTYSLARCSDGREVLGSPIGVTRQEDGEQKRNVLALMHV